MNKKILFNYNEVEDAIEYISNIDNNFIFNMYGVDGLNIRRSETPEYCKLLTNSGSKYSNYFINYVNRSIYVDNLYKISIDFVKTIMNNSTFNNSIDFTVDYVRNESYSFIRYLFMLNEYDICTDDDGINIYKISRIDTDQDIEYEQHCDNEKIKEKIKNFLERKVNCIKETVKDRDLIVIKFVPKNKSKYRKIISKIKKIVSRRKYKKKRNEFYLYFDKLNSDEIRNILNLIYSL